MTNVAFTCMILTFAARAALAQQAASDTGNAVQGKVLFESVGCYECHGLAGQGAPATGPRLARTQIPFAAFLAILRHPITQMPPYEAAVLSDQEAVDIYAYLEQLPAPRDPKTIPQLNIPVPVRGSRAH
jgi:ubiquinol-cytochrome c reductase cytochrome c subunit